MLWSSCDFCLHIFNTIVYRREKFKSQLPAITKINLFHKFLSKCTWEPYRYEIFPDGGISFPWTEHISYEKSQFKPLQIPTFNLLKIILSWFQIDGIRWYQIQIILVQIRWSNLLRKRRSLSYICSLTIASRAFGSNQVWNRLND